MGVWAAPGALGNGNADGVGVTITTTMHGFVNPWLQETCH